MTAAKCPREQWLTIGDALRRMPRRAFDYVWLIQPPSYDPALTAGWDEVWRDGGNVLYRIGDRPTPALPEIR